MSDYSIEELLSELEADGELSPTILQQLTQHISEQQERVTQANNAVVCYNFARRLTNLLDEIGGEIDFTLLEMLEGKYARLRNILKNSKFEPGGAVRSIGVKTRELGQSLDHLDALVLAARRQIDAAERAQAALGGKASPELIKAKIKMKQRLRLIPDDLGPAREREERPEVVRAPRDANRPRAARVAPAPQAVNAIQQEVRLGDFLAAPIVNGEIQWRAPE